MHNEQNNAEKESIKILSVDFDYIMYPCIKLYNSYVAEDENPTVIWDKIQEMLDIESHLSYDGKALRAIADIVAQNICNGANFYAIENHEEIVDFLKDNKIDNQIDLLNIDFHHDVMYHNDTAELIDFKNYNCSNWVGYLFYNKQLERYRWLKCPNSDLFNNIDKFNYTIMRIDEFSKIENDFDMIFFCLSPHWIPYKYRHLYYMLADIFTKIGGVSQ